MSLYLEHFGLREPPFRITPHTDYFFSGADRGPTLAALIHAVTEEEGIVKLTGEVGSGKTMLCRMLLERLPASVDTLYIATPSLSRHDMLGAIADELAIPSADKAPHALLRAVQEALIARHAVGQRVVVLIDEAHAMPAESLEEIRLLSNLETKSTKLLQIVLFAQPELDERLAANAMRPLRERITQHFNLGPLQAGDVADYLEFRLRAAGCRVAGLFDAAAVRRIAKISEGLSRRINILADKALLAAWSRDGQRVDADDVAIAAADARFAPLHRPEPTQRLWWRLAGGALAAILLLLAFTLGTRSAAPDRDVVAVAAIQPPPAPDMAAAPAPAPVQPAQPTFGPLTQKHMEQYATWIASAPRRNYFIQLFATNAGNFSQIEGFLVRASEALDPADLRVYRSSLSGHDRIGVIYGDFPTRETAATAMRALPASILAAQPFPRQVSRLH
ncbi:MAG: AAA family ATPase [Betaproteobacteria bacterium]|nr:AAA family ATPase [Betaproteobacteria bacterium]MCL2886764.1 AAA family ATPase [Betaproteobacteria bacterium]